MKTIFLDYQSLKVVILVSTFGLLLVYSCGEKIINEVSCPCTTTAALSPLSYVGNSYYCELVSWNFISSNRLYNTYFNDTLWDGAGCIDNYCNNTTQPWFYHQLNQITQNDIEARICAHGQYYFKLTLIDQLELYIE